MRRGRIAAPGIRSRPRRTSCSRSSGALWSSSSGRSRRVGEPGSCCSACPHISISENIIRKVCGPPSPRTPERRFSWSFLMLTVLLLLVSNVFMTFAWYGHLKYRSAPLFKVILISWGIAFLEYCFQVPANRIGSYQFSAAQLKVIQEVITLVVFSVFSITYLKQDLRWNHAVGFGLIVAAVFVIFRKW